MRPYLALRVPALTYDEFLLESQKELDLFQGLLESITVLSADDFRENFGPLAGGRITQEQIIANCQKNILRLREDLEITSRLYGVIKSDLAQKRLYEEELVVQIMRAVEAAKGLVVCGFWADLMSPSPVYHGFCKINPVELCQINPDNIQTIEELRKALKIIRPVFSRFKIRRVVRLDPERLDAYKGYLKTAIWIAETVAKLNEFYGGRLTVVS